jgi:hypothetical protein
VSEETPEQTVRMIELRKARAVNGDAERAWEKWVPQGNFYPTQRDAFLAGFAARDAEIAGLKAVSAKLIASLDPWTCSECERGLDEEEMDLEENFDPCDVCGPIREGFETLRALAAPAPGAKGGE